MTDTGEKGLRGSIELERIEQPAPGAVAATPAVQGSLAERVEKSKPRQKSYLMDLRIHSPVSLGYLSVGGIDTAPALVRLAKVKGLDMIAVTDFYSGSYIDRVIDAARESDLTIIPGVVIRCKVGICDDAVMTCLFPESYSGSRVAEFLGAIQVPAEAAGNKNFLVKLPFAEVLKQVEALGGMALPSRLDKTPHRQAAIPILVEEYGFRAFDLAYPDSARYFKKNWPKTKFQLFCFSNAHALAQVGSRMAKVKLAEGGFAGIRSVLNRSQAE